MSTQSAFETIEISRIDAPLLHLCDLSKTTTRSALTVDRAAQGSLRVASG